MSKIRDIIENERGLHTDTVATDSELQGVADKRISTVTSNVMTSGGATIDSNSNLVITDGVFTYTDGIDGNGFVRSSEQVTESIDFAGVSDGLKWVGRKLDGSGYIFEDRKPSVGLYEKESADDNRLVFDVESGKYCTTTGGELITNGTFDVDTSGWTSTVYNGSTYETSTSSLTWNSGRGKIVNPTGKDYAAIEQELSGLTIGAKYVAQATFDTSDTGYFSIGEFSAIGNGATSGEGFQSSGLTTGVYTIEFIATASSMYVTLQLSTNVDGASLHVDDISVYKLEPTLDQPLATPVSFLPNPVMVASETPMEIREDDELLTNVMDSLDVQGKVAMGSPIYGDKPIYTGYAGGTSIKAAGVIFNWTTEVDTHNAYNNGLWTCPKDGWYRFNPRVWNKHGDTTITTVNSAIYINGEVETAFYTSGTNKQKYIGVEPTILKELKKGDTMYIESVAASSAHFIYFEDGKDYTNIVIEYIGETK